MSEGSAERVPEPKRDRAEEFCREFWNQYEPIVEAARRAAIVTAGDDWQLRYKHEVKESRKKIVGACKVIEENVKLIASAGSCETIEKGIKDTLKTLVEEREGHEAWFARAIRPRAMLADDSQRLLNECKRKARDVETASPLVHGGLAHEVAQRIHDHWPGVEWDEENGAVTVVEALL
ncbi:MAG: hypothetical protein QG602_2125 [Verrucomicrobiota bacterium]|nr:hypothetical protein [Verrucomicrobiota bacterium]